LPTNEAGKDKSLPGAAPQIGFPSLNPQPGQASSPLGNGGELQKGGKQIQAEDQSETGTPADIEIALWESVKDSQNPDDYRAYLKKFPNGAFADLAKSRVRILAAENEEPVPKGFAIISLIDLDQQLAQEYNQKLLRVMVAATMEDTSVFGQITVYLNVDGSGKIAVNHMDPHLVTVDPPAQQKRVSAMLSRAFSSMRLNPPKNRAGDAVILENWRLGYKIVTWSGKITLIKQ
jgi:hypothetical protein